MLTPRELYAARAAQGVLTQTAPGLVIDGWWGTTTMAAFRSASQSAQESIRKLLRGLDTSPEDLNVQFKASKITDAGSKEKFLVTRKELLSVSKDWKSIFDLEVVPLVLQVAKERGFVNPALAVAQMRHESRNGKSVSAAYNWAGLKPAKGQASGQLVWTTEIVNGARKKVQVSFAKFDDAKQFVNAYFDRIQRIWPKAVAAKTAREWIIALNVGGKSMAYATEKPAVYLAGIERFVV